MPTTYRFPVFLFTDAEGYVTATLLDYFPRKAAVAATADEAVRQLSRYVASVYREYPHYAGPEFFHPRLIIYRVDVRPEYHARDRIYACSETIALRIPCVYGRDENDLRVCMLPTLNISFHYYDPDELKGLVMHYVQSALRGLTPQHLSRYFGPESMRLTEITVRAPRHESVQEDEPEIEALAGVAEPLGKRAVQRLYAKPWEREEEVEDLIARLGKERANVIIVGESGVGKTAVLVEAVNKLEQMLQKKRKEQDDEDGDDDEPESSYARRFWLTSAARLVAGMRYLGMWEERCEKIIAELSEFNGVLCVDDLLSLLRVGGEGPGDSIAAFLLTFLQHSELRMVAEATPAELDACRRLLPGLVEVFQILRIEPFDRQGALTVLGRAAEAYGSRHTVAVEADVVPTVYRLFSRFLPYSAFPGKATAFMRKLFERVAGDGGDAVSGEHVIGEFVRETGLPELFLRDRTTLREEDVAETFSRQVIGQEEAGRAAVRLVSMFKAGLNDPERPVGVLLFCGPTGVGKTALATAIARFFFGHGEDDDRLVRLDMSEYGGPGAAARLLGELDDEPSELITKVRRQPFVVVLLDEIEKAAPEVYDLLLGVLDEGRLTDTWGRTTMFRSAVIIMTSNLGAQRHESIGFGAPPAPSYEAEALAFFRPEFFNRLDALVTFNPLTTETIHAITRKELSEIAQREGLTKADLRLHWSDAVVDHLARKGFDRRYGARPLQRTLEKLVVARLARYLVEHPGLNDADINLEVGAEGQVMLSVR